MLEDLESDTHYLICPVHTNNSTSHLYAVLSVKGQHYIVDPYLCNDGSIRILQLTAGALAELGCTHITDPLRTGNKSVDSCKNKVNGCIKVGFESCKQKELDKVVRFSYS